MSTSFHPKTSSELAAEADAKARAEQLVAEFNPTPSKSAALVFMIEMALMQWFARGESVGAGRSTKELVR